MNSTHVRTPVRIFQINKASGKTRSTKVKRAVSIFINIRADVTFHIGLLHKANLSKPAQTVLSHLTAQSFQTTSSPSNWTNRRIIMENRRNVMLYQSRNKSRCRLWQFKLRDGRSMVCGSKTVCGNWFSAFHWKLQIWTIICENKLQNMYVGS